jgi:hypothetical protein
MPPKVDSLFLHRSRSEIIFHGAFNSGRELLFWCRELLVAVRCGNRDAGNSGLLGFTLLTDDESRFWICAALTLLQFPADLSNLSYRSKSDLTDPSVELRGRSVAWRRRARPMLRPSASGIGNASGRATGKQTTDGLHTRDARRFLLTWWERILFWGLYWRPGGGFCHSPPRHLIEPLRSSPKNLQQFWILEGDLSIGCSLGLPST